METSKLIDYRFKPTKEDLDSSFQEFWINFLLYSSLRSIERDLLSPDVHKTPLINIGTDENLNIIKRDIEQMVLKYRDTRSFFIQMRKYLSKHPITREHVDDSVSRFWKKIVLHANRVSLFENPKSIEIDLNVNSKQLEYLEDAIDDLMLEHGSEVTVFYDKLALYVKVSKIVNDSIFPCHFPLK